MNRAWFCCTLSKFDEISALETLGRLAQGSAASGFVSQYAEQIRTWQTQLEILACAVREILASRPESRAWVLMLEYEIPRRQRRIDAVLLAGSSVIVIEFKIGASIFDRNAIWQVEDYALDLRDFHRESRGRHIVPVLVATEAQTTREERSQTSISVHCTGASTLASTLEHVTQYADPGDSTSIDADRWINSSYSPTPTIVEATQRLFAKHSVRNLSHAYADNLTDTVDAIAAAVSDARQKRERCIVFVTGVPGAGKTLAGLAAAHDVRVADQERGLAAFMSGNGPLVRVLQEALIRDAKRNGEPRRTAEHRVRLLVQNIHAFIDEYGLKDTQRAPHEDVIIFDEAQRAWDADCVNKKRSSETHKSEPALVLDIMARCQDGCVVIALVGGGQEIHIGEAGLEEWGRAVAEAGTCWRVVASPEVLTGGSSVAGHRLFSAEVPHGVSVSLDRRMHLSVSVRSPRAQRIADWVNAVLNLDAERARTALGEISGFRVAVCRDLDAVRGWLRDAARGEMRPGLLASSGSVRHRAYGLEVDTSFRRNYPVPRWFLDPANDVRSSYRLEVALTEFECQGLELDLVGVCWGDDLTLSSDGKWEMRAFRGSKWQAVNGTQSRQYLLNKYRVLLTRAREGFIVWMPPGDSEDPTRDPARLDRTAIYLQQCGLPLIEDCSSEQQG